MFPVDDKVFYVPGLDYFVAFSQGRPPTRIHIRSMEHDVVGERNWPGTNGVSGHVPSVVGGTARPLGSASRPAAEGWSKIAPTRFDM